MLTVNDIPFIWGTNQPREEEDEDEENELTFVLTQDKQRDFIKSLAVTLEDITRIKNIPQRTQEWKLQREGRITGSIVGSLVGHNYFCRKAEQLELMLWSGFQGNDATRWGTEMEPIAAAAYEKYTGYIVDYPGLIVHESFPWMAYSPDGVFVEDGIPGLLEIKCPYSKKLYGRIPMYYYDQIQYGMWLLNCAFADFFVYTPTKCSLERYMYNESYVKEFLLPSLNKFYFNLYMPLFLLKQASQLEEGATSWPNTVQVEGVPEFVY